jgi:hypothetical protein
MNATPSDTSRPTFGPRTYTNGVLTVIAVLLGMAVIGQSSGPRSADAGQDGQVGVVGGQSLDEENSGRISAAEQRKAMITELRAMGSRLERIEAALAKGINVKVTSMPAESRVEARPAPAPAATPAK